VEIKLDESTNSVDTVIEISKDMEHNEAAAKHSYNEVFCGFKTYH